MKTTFNQDYLLKNCGCYSQDEAKALSFMQKPEFTLLDVVNAEIPIKDKFWFVVRKCELTDLQNKKIAVGCAEITLAIYENKYPEDKRPRKAIEAAKQYLEGEISREDLLECRRAAADAAYAADAAAYAADAAAYAAADAAAYKQSLLNFLVDFVEKDGNI